MCFRLFVYGTLRRGFSNHDRLEQARFLGEQATVAEYDVTSVSGFPALIRGSRSVGGELYAVDEALLHRLDIFEGNDYRRAPVHLKDGSVAEAYVLARDGA